MNEIYTRQQYMEDSRKDGIAAHRRYFGQFVTPETIRRVVQAIGGRTHHGINRQTHE